MDDLSCVRLGVTHNQWEVRGVWFDDKKQKFRACVDRRRTSGRRRYLGYFDTYVEAAAAYDAAAAEEYGEAAAFNFPLKGERQIVVGGRADVCAHGHSFAEFGRKTTIRGKPYLACKECNRLAVAKRRERLNSGQNHAVKGYRRPDGAS